VGMKIEAIWSISCCRRGHTIMSVQILFDTFFEVLSRKGGPYNSTDLTQISR
jgi:hypothetical protein